MYRRRVNKRHLKVRRAAGLSLAYKRFLHAHRRGGLLAPAGGLLAPAGGAVRRRRSHATYRKKRGGFLPFLPLIAAAIPALFGGISGAMDIAERAKRMKAADAAAKAGQGMRRRRRVARRGRAVGYGRVIKRRVIHKKRGHGLRRKRVVRRGRGAVSDFIGRIPLLGGILGPLTSAIGLGLTSPNNTWYLRNRGCGGMLSRNAINITKPNPMMMIKYPSHADMAKVVKAAAMSAGKGLGRRGHYRYVNGKRVHVSGSGMYKKKAARRVVKKGHGVKRAHKRVVHKRRVGGYNVFPWKSGVARVVYRA